MSINDVELNKLYFIKRRWFVSDEDELINETPIVLLKLNRNCMQHMLHNSVPAYEIKWLDFKGRVVYDVWAKKTAEEDTWKSEHLKD